VGKYFQKSGVKKFIRRTGKKYTVQIRGPERGIKQTACTYIMLIDEESEKKFIKSFWWLSGKIRCQKEIFERWSVRGERVTREINLLREGGQSNVDTVLLKPRPMLTLFCENPDQC
jgi:hypothetical protein